MCQRSLQQHWQGQLSLYLLAGWELLIKGTDAQIVFGQMYFSESWQAVFRIDNSFVIWGVVLGLGLALRKAWVIALAGAALLHIGLDFPLHHDDGRAHFWPLSTWVFQSPVSYWDRAHYGQIVGPIEIGLSLILCGVLWRRFTGWVMRSFITVLAVAEAAPVFIWMFVFAGG